MGDTAGRGEVSKLLEAQFQSDYFQTMESQESQGGASARVPTSAVSALVHKQRSGEASIPSCVSALYPVLPCSASKSEAVFS